MNHKITKALTKAKVHYEEILDDAAGIYMWVNPDEKSTLDILRLFRGAPFKGKDSTELHCTVMYCKGHMPQTFEAPPDLPYTGQITRVNNWVDHKNRNILVLAIESDQLQVLHKNLTSQSFAHSFDEFSPHITIAKDVPLGSEQRLWLDEINERLAVTPLTIAFSPQLRAAPLS